MAAPLPLLSQLRLTRRRTVLCTWVLLLACSSAVADEADVDLQGVLPDYIPNGLTGGDFAQLEDEWSEWGTATSRLVADFYTSEDNAVRGRRATLEQLQSRRSIMKAALQERQDPAGFGPLADLYGRLSRRLDVSAALLATIDLQDDPQLREAAAQLLLAM